MRIDLVNPTGDLKSKLSELALIDTGAALTTIPERIARRLELRTISKKKVRTAAEFPSPRPIICLRRD